MRTDSRNTLNRESSLNTVLIFSMCISLFYLATFLTAPQPSLPLSGEGDRPRRWKGSFTGVGQRLQHPLQNIFFLILADHLKAQTFVHLFGRFVPLIHGRAGDLFIAQFPQAVDHHAHDSGTHPFSSPSFKPDGNGRIFRLDGHITDADIFPVFQNFDKIHLTVAVQIIAHTPDIIQVGLFLVVKDALGVLIDIGVLVPLQGFFIMPVILFQTNGLAKDNNGAYLWQPSYQAGEPDRILGYSVHTSGYVPENAIAFGDYSYYNIGDRGTRSFKQLTELFAGNGMIGYVAKERVDGKLILPEAVQILKLKTE